MKQARSDPTPPRLAERLLEWAAPEGRTGDSVVGDAREELAAHARSGSRVPPGLWYWLHVLPIVLHGVFLGLGSAPGAVPGALSQAGRDLKLALRTLGRRPGLALAVVTTLALGIGGSTVAFSVANAALLAPLPYDDPDELMGVYRFRTDLPRGFPAPGSVSRSYSVSPVTFRDWQEGARAFEALGAFAGSSVSYSTAEGPVPLSAVNATSGVFQALGVSAAQGRTFLPEEDEVGGTRVALLSHGFWERVLASDPEALGRSVSLSGVPHTVVGIMPPGFSFPYDGVDLWVPLTDDRKAWPNRDGGFLQVVGRLADGVTLAAAQDEMSRLHARLAGVHTSEQNRTARLYPWREIQVAGSRPGILLLAAATGLVLLIACANITNLLLVRALERDRELAIRTALGGGRRHLVAQLVAEALVMALLGGVAAVLVALASMPALLAVIPVTLPNATAIRIGPAVLAFAGLLSCAAGLATGLLPALRVARRRTGPLLREAERRGGARRNRAHSFLAVAEMALAFVLLSGAGLALKSFRETTAVDTGYEAENRLTMRVRLPARYHDDGPAVSAFFEALTEGLALHPAVSAVGAASQMPYSGGVSFPPGSVETDEGIVSVSIHSSTVTPGYFGAAGMTLSSGRPLTGGDQAGTPPVAVVNQAAARALWPEEDPIGRRVRLDLPGDSVWRSVVGVVEDVRYGFGWTTFPEFYTPLAQRPLWYQTVLVHADRDQSGVAQAMREALWSLAPDIPVTVNSWEELTRRSRGFAFARFGALAMMLLAGVAAALAVVGVYGVVAFTVRMRRHEFGVRLALGGEQPGILLSVLRRGFLMATLGIVIGLGVVLAAGPFIDPTLLSGGTRDPLTLSAVALLLVLTGLGASALPAFRATRVDPVTVLQTE